MNYIWLQGWQHLTKRQVLHCWTSKFCHLIVKNQHWTIKIKRYQNSVRSNRKRGGRVEECVHWREEKDERNRATVFVFENSFASLGRRRKKRLAKGRKCMNQDMSSITQNYIQMSESVSQASPCEMFLLYSLFCPPSSVRLQIQPHILLNRHWDYGD